MIDAVIAFSFGRPSSIRPNQVIAKEAVYFAQLYGAPIITQRDIPLENRLEVEFMDTIGEMEKSYVSTFKVVQRFTKIAKERNWKGVLVIAAPDHIMRCVRDLQKMGFITFVPYDLDWHKYPINTWFDKNSTQWFTRTRFAFLIRETCIRFTPWWLYKRITGDRA